jgi:hyperosmotically inducible periplasmic protein
MDRSQLITAVWLCALLLLAACNQPRSAEDAVRESADSRSSRSPAQESAVATSGTLRSEATVIPLEDASVTSRIQAKYFLDQAIKGRRIDVDTRAGIVTLSGDVASDEERAQALLLARTTPGVERVEDALTVNAAIGTPPAAGAAATDLPVPAKADDEALTALVESRLADDPSLIALTIDVTAKDGVLLLDGAVPTAAVKQRVLSLARGTDGVLQVIDRISVRRR